MGLTFPVQEEAQALALLDHRHPLKTEETQDGSCYFGSSSESFQTGNGVFIQIVFIKIFNEQSKLIASRRKTQEYEFVKHRLQYQITIYLVLAFSCSPRKIVSQGVSVIQQRTIYRVMFQSFQLKEFGPNIEYFIIMDSSRGSKFN